MTERGKWFFHFIFLLLSITTEKITYRQKVNRPSEPLAGRNNSPIVLHPPKNNAIVILSFYEIRSLINEPSTPDDFGRYFSLNNSGKNAPFLVAIS